MNARRIFVEKKEGFRIEAQSLLAELNENLNLNLQHLRLINVYDLFGFSDTLVEQCRYRVFGEIVTDLVTDTCHLDGKKYLAVENIPGQFDQRASSAVDCVHLLDPAAQIRIRSSRLLIFDDDVDAAVLDKIAHYYINPVECRPKNLDALALNEQAEVNPMEDLTGFIRMTPADYAGFCKSHGLAMNTDDLDEVVRYFRAEGRDPLETELRILDTYWSDHCRHTTFTTELTDITIRDSFIKEDMEKMLQRFYDIRKELGRTEKSLCMMELATIGARYLSAKGLLDDLERSEENNACSVFVQVDVDGKMEKWLLQFKNETHNHPTEIEPFGGASTCLGGAIRDPLSGRSYVYQAMRVTGAGDICKPVSETMPGKLPQLIISKKAAAGYSSYGNQIGLATTMVREIYDPGYTAKRMEIGAVVGAVKAENVRRESPAAGDVILLLGGRTGRDGVGGATGSSKSHDESSLEVCGSEVQKGNAPEERKLQRLFRRPEVTRLIKKSNDFGAGGVSVAIGELAPGLDIYLDRVPVKYAGLNSTELAISESQERMAVVVRADDRAEFEQYCHRDNVEVTYVADVTDSGRMRIFNGKQRVCDLSRTFIDSAGAKHYATVEVAAVENTNPFVPATCPKDLPLKQKMSEMISSPNVASQKGLVEMFDSTIGRSTVLMPFGGSRQATETQVSVQKLPVDGYTDTASMMAFGYNPTLTRWSPYHGAAYAVVEACAKVAAAGGDYSTMRFSYQEYFEKMTRDPQRWGKPFSALLGALKMQIELGLPSIGGKDSMSGSFEQLNVPPTLVAFGITTVNAKNVISPEWKQAGNRIYIIRHQPQANHMPDTAQLSKNWKWICQQISAGRIVSGWAVGFGGMAEGVCKMSFGNRKGVCVQCDESDLFATSYGSILVEATGELEWPDAVLLGHVTDTDMLEINGVCIPIAEMEAVNASRYAKIYPAKVEPLFNGKMDVAESLQESEPLKYVGEVPADGPVVCLPIFPGSNCDYDTAKAFRTAGAQVRPLVFRNLTEEDVLQSIAELSSAIDACQILAFCGGFSCGDEPDGSGKFIASVICNEQVAAAIRRLQQRHGLILGICNGFQALVKSGLLPYGQIGAVTVDSPTLFRNDINRHISQMAETEVVSVNSPWLAGFTPGERHCIALSHGEGKFVVNPDMATRLFANGQVAFRYTDNPNGSYYDIEGIVSSDGLILGKMGHSERYENHLFKNISGQLSQPIFNHAVNYFKNK
ncbi:MAG: phosphoribosylformylglycinamidine synthase [Bacteroidales bacterium]|nr:phosphoribosylformylglycinamidine synthase [Bacteroidales bacterium]